MNNTAPRPRRAKLTTVLKSQHGASDMTSSLVGALVAGILLVAGVFVTVAVIPGTQNGEAKDALDTVTTAQSVAKSTDRRFFNGDVLADKKYMTPSEKVRTAADAGGSCYVAISKSDTGRFYFITDKNPKPSELTSTSTGCIDDQAVQDLADDLGGFAPSAAGGKFVARYQDTTFIRGTSKAVKPFVSGGQGTYTYTLSGALPAGVAFNTANGSFTGPASWGSDSTAISAGNGHSCGITQGDLRCWGTNASGQLGNGTTVASPAPVAVAGPLADLNVTQVSAGLNHSCAVAAGEAYCWGANGSGQLGSAGPASSLPIKVNTVGTALQGLKVTSVSAGSDTTCAIAGGKAFCWGSTVGGVRGDGISAGGPFTASQVQALSKPTRVIATGHLAGKTISAIDVGHDHACAIANTRAYCWGANGSGQLGTGDTAGSSVPVPVKETLMGVGKVTGIDVGGQNPTAASCAVTDSKAFCWGSNTGGFLGTGSAATSSTTPVQVTGVLTGRTVSSVSVGNRHACVTSKPAAGGTGSGHCWGTNTDGRLGNGTATSSTVPVPVTTPGRDVTAVHAGNSHTCTIASKGAYCWGSNAAGKLGDGTTTNRTAPVAVNGLAPFVGLPADVTVAVSDGVDTEIVPIRLDVK